MTSSPAQARAVASSLGWSQGITAYIRVTSRWVRRDLSLRPRALRTNKPCVRGARSRWRRCFDVRAVVSLVGASARMASRVPVVGPDRKGCHGMHDAPKET